MRLSEFWRLMDGEFGSASGRHLAATMALTELGSRTADEALEAGENPREVWLAVCRAKEVPEARWLGAEVPLRRDRWDG
ncbi:MAG: DUF3046 domain-containing protein [Arthrobacter sp.]|jgi:hypothetical protein|nr:DUF3046 domain-containing protein [Arthrobacter sp.]